MPKSDSETPAATRTARPPERHQALGHDAMGGMLGFATYGGRINRVARDATASAQRAAILDMACSTGWGDARSTAPFAPTCDAASPIVVSFTLPPSGNTRVPVSLR